MGLDKKKIATQIIGKLLKKGWDAPWGAWGDTLWEADDTMVWIYKKDREESVAHFSFKDIMSRLDTWKVLVGEEKRIKRHVVEAGSKETDYTIKAELLILPSYLYHIAEYHKLDDERRWKYLEQFLKGSE